MKEEEFKKKSFKVKQGIEIPIDNTKFQNSNKKGENMDKDTARKFYEAGKKVGKSTVDENSLANIGLGIGLGAVAAGGIYLFSLINSEDDTAKDSTQEVEDEFEKKWRNNEK